MRSNPLKQIKVSLTAEAQRTQRRGFSRKLCVLCASAVKTFFCLRCFVKNSPSQSGSIIFYILIAIALFAALGFAVSHNSRGGGGTNNDELIRLQASEILQYGRGMRSTVQTMQINNVGETELSFENTAVTGYANADCADDSCRIFKAGGGGMTYVKPTDDWLDTQESGGANFGDWFFSGGNAVTGTGTAAPDLLMVLPWVRKNLCIAINDLLGVANPAGIPPKDNGNADLALKFTGSYTSTQSIGGGDPEIESQRAGCFEGAGSPATGTYHFFQVLLTR